MSIEAMAVVLHHSTAKGTDKVVMLGIANHDGDGGAYPAIATLARYSNVSDRAVQDAIARLVEAGELVVHVKGGGVVESDPRYRTNRFELLVACPPSCDGSRQHRVSGEADRTTGRTPVVKPSASSGEVGRSPVVKPASPKPSSNHPRSHVSARASLFEQADAFEAFWTNYPRKVSKPTARRSFAAALAKADAHAIGVGLEQWRTYWAAANTPADKIPHPSTWLNGERWNDTPPAVEQRRGRPAAMRVDTDRTGEAQVMRGSDW